LLIFFHAFAVGAIPSLDKLAVEQRAVRALVAVAPVKQRLKQIAAGFVTKWRSFVER